jgi:hypothetical protein
MINGSVTVSLVPADRWLISIVLASPAIRPCGQVARFGGLMVVAANERQANGGRDLGM